MKTVSCFINRYRQYIKSFILRIVIVVVYRIKKGIVLWTIPDFFVFDSKTSESLTGP